MERLSVGNIVLGARADNIIHELREEFISKNVFEQLYYKVERENERLREEIEKIKGRKRG